MNSKPLMACLVFCLCVFTPSYALFCPGAKQLVKRHGHWKVLGNPNWREAPFVSPTGKNPHFGGAYWNHGWVPANLIKRPDCWYWLGGDFEDHTEVIYKYETINPKHCNKQHWKDVGGMSKGVRCTSNNRLECYFPIDKCR